MKRYLPLICFILVIFNIVLLFSLYFNYSKPKSFESSQINTNIDRWYDVESSKYKIFTAGTVDFSIVSVLDKEKDLLLVLDESCEVPISEEHKNEPFYNSSVGIKIQGPYKSIYPKEGSDNTFTQSVLNSGCVHDEGEISIFTDEENRLAKCEVKIEYKDLGC